MDDQLKKRKIDPSESKQIFTDINLHIHCCRYWICTQWECTNMAFPFWRIYHNTTKGARIVFNGIETELTNEKIIIIPPNTSYSNYLITKELVIKQESIEGERVNKATDTTHCIANEKIDHLFLHFNLGLPFDFVKPGIYTIPADSFFSQLLQRIKTNCIYTNEKYDIKSSMDIHILILSALSQLPNELWMKTEMDKRITHSMQYIQNNIQSNLSNSKLATLANMATNSFARLFSENAGESIQQFVVKSRIEYARLLLHHTDMNIDTIAASCGFCDRYHFSKSFKQILKMSPGHYKKHITLH